MTHVFTNNLDMVLILYSTTKDVYKKTLLLNQQLINHLRHYYYYYIIIITRVSMVASTRRKTVFNTLLTDVFQLVRKPV